MAGPFSARVRGAPAAAPRVSSITQVTHDGFRKTNLLADDSELFVTELAAANRVIAKVSLPDSERSLVASPFSNLQALDLSPDRSRLLVAPIQAGSSDDEFWTLPVGSGSPQRIGDLAGRDASGSADGQHLVLSQGAVLYVAGAAGAQKHELYTAKGSIFAPHFSPDGQRIRFTVSDAAQNTTSIWEIGQDSSNPHALLENWQYASSACCGNWTADGRYYIFQASLTLPNTSTNRSPLWALPDSALGTSDNRFGMFA